ncbi:hypothetical protein C5167_024914 [Papaver somniferum]|uniref:Conserved oligomeric Golgi complex subunit 7 n=1 Tax=Papaver somniferum TaxID=3469 RepID=A0A4Y7JTQ1_PAPSO|nr:hypothetical protein C5167_024914 [Papaver somniferum]
MKEKPLKQFRVFIGFILQFIGCQSGKFVSRINLANGEVVPERSALDKGVLDILSGDMPKGSKIQTKHLEVLLDILKAIYSPYESFKQRYGQIECIILSSEIAGLDLRGAVGGQAFNYVEHFEVCKNLFHNFGEMHQFTGVYSIFQQTLKSLGAVCGVDFTSDATGTKKEIGSDRREGAYNAHRLETSLEEEEWSIVQGALQILTVADRLTSRSSVLEASLRSTLPRLSTSSQWISVETSFHTYHGELSERDTVNYCWTTLNTSGLDRSRDHGLGWQREISNLFMVSEFHCTA